MKNKANVPQIRFAGFTDAWEQRKLGEIADRTYGGGTPKTDIMEYWDGYIPWIQSSNLTEHELFNVDIQKHITDDGLKKSAAQLVPPNSVAIVSHVGVGKLVFIPFSYATSQDFISLSELKADPIFTCYSVYKRLQNDLHIVQGSAIKGITKDDLLGKAIMLPSEPEQIRIGGYFRQLDHLITLHQRECDLLDEFKQICLQRMFPKKGSNVPEIRFAGFTGAWKQRKLGEILQTLPFKPFLKEPEQDGEFEIIQQGNEPVIGFANGKPCEDYADTVIFGDHTLSLYKPKRPFFVATDGVRIVKGKQKINGFYLLTLLEKYKPKSEGYKRYYAILADSKCLITNNDIEQKQIGTFFRHLDHLITLHRHELEELQNIKKTMLEKMFV